MEKKKKKKGKRIKSVFFSRRPDDISCVQNVIEYIIYSINILDPSAV